jgi:hypothetical protein
LERQAGRLWLQLRGLPVRRLCLLVLCAAGTACASAGPQGAPGGSGGSGVAPLPTATAFSGRGNDFANQPSAVTDTVVGAPRAEVWAVMPSVFRTLGVGGYSLDPRAFVIGNDGWRATTIDGTRLSVFLQCGSGIAGPNADRYEVTLRLAVQLDAQGPEATLVRTVVDALARPRDSGGASLQCASQGTLERRVAGLIAAWLADPEGGGLETAPPAIAGRRLPAAGDVVRVVCSPLQTGPAQLGEGAFVGVGEGEMLLELGPGPRRVAVPVASLSSIQLRERRSRSRVGGVVGALLGMGAGGLVGSSKYDPNAEHHFGKGVAVTIGAVLGGVGGAVLGSIGGSFVRHDAWVDAPLELVLRQAGLGAAPAAGAPGARGCPSLARDR